jgi:hypothetical protein
MSFLFAKEKTPKELAREWQIELRRQMRACDKEIRGACSCLWMGTVIPNITSRCRNVCSAELRRLKYSQNIVVCCVRARHLNHAKPKHAPLTCAGIELAEGKTKRAVRDAAKAGQSGPARILALELARSKRAKERIMVTKSRLNSVSMQIRSQIGRRGMLLPRRVYSF